MRWRENGRDRKMRDKEGGRKKRLEERVSRKGRKGDIDRERDRERERGRDKKRWGKRENE